MRYALFTLLLTASLAAAPQRFIVELRTAGPGVRAEAAQRFRSEAAEVAEVRREFRRVFHGAAVELREGQSIEDLRRLPSVVAVHPDREVVAYGSVPERRLPGAALHNVRTNAGGAGVVVAVIDTGIDGTHPALAGKVIGGYDFVNDDADPMDDHTHGTHVAGIIAAQSAQKTGVAPNVRLLAYKVLNERGRGTTSDVIAGIERALDPNNDGNLSDRADVLNLSLGNTGHPDDPLSRAVDNAVAAGAVVCVAAGNDETFHRIGSPAGAARAITVGASTIDDDGQPSLAYFSSRGPATQSSAIKPDLLAPGRDILSTGLNHGYLTASGTSMATPYVSGLAALLLEEHPDWTPERVKAALVTTAAPVAMEEIMSQGSGIAAIGDARANTLVASPTQVNFGLNGTLASSWSATRTIALRNDSAAARTIHASVSGASAAMDVRVTPAELTIAAGATAQIEVAIDVDNTTLGKPPSWSFSFGGLVRLESAGETVKLPWAFVRAGRATISGEGLDNAMWLAPQPRKASPTSLGENAIEVLLEPGVYDIIVAALQNGETRVVVAEEREVAGDVAVMVTPEVTPHGLRLAATDSGGAPFPDSGTNTRRMALARLLLPNGKTLPLPDMTGRAIRTSAFSDRFAILASEAFVDGPGARVFVAQYPEQRGVQSSRVLAVGPADYAAQEVELHFPAAAQLPRREVGVLVRDWPRQQNEHRLPPAPLRFAVEGASWKATVYLTGEVSDAVATGVNLQLFTAQQADYPATLNAPMIRRGENGFFAAWGFTQPPVPVRSYTGELMSFGRGAIHLPGQIHGGTAGIAGDAEVAGHRGDRRRADSSTARVRILDANGNEAGSGTVGIGSSFFVPLQNGGRYTAELRIGPFAMDDRSGEALQRTTLDTTHGPSSPPMITSFAVLDGAGRHVTRLPADGNGSLVFSAADHESMQYRRVAGSATRAFYRRRGEAAWVALAPVATGDEESAGDLGRQPVGVVYRVDLADALAQGSGEYEIALEVADEQGNTTRWELAPAFIAESRATMPRRRAVRP